MVPVTVTALALTAPFPQASVLLLVGVYNGGQVDLAGVNLLLEKWSHPIEYC